MWGPGKEMLKAYEANRNKVSKRNSLKENFDQNYAKDKPLKFKEVSAQELESIKNKFLEKQKKQNRKTAIILLAITGIIMIVGYTLFT